MRGLATRRARWNPRLPLAVGAVVVLGAALPAALAVGGGTMLDDGVRSAVAAAGPADRGTQVSARLDDADPAAQDRAARLVVGRVFEGVPATTWTGLRSGNLPLTGLPASPAGEIRLVAEVLPDAAAHAELVTGRWPAAAPGAAAAGAPIPAALHAGAARTLGIATGDRLTLGTPGTPAVRTVDVVGLWQVPDAADPYWFGDPLELTGAERDTVRGPLLVAAGPDGTPPDVGDRWSARWRTVVDPAGLEAGDAERLARRLARLETEVEAIPTAGGGVARTAGGLAETLAYPRLAVPLARSATVAVLVLVVGLAALVAAQAAALLAADRGRESGVIRARGASRLQLARLTTVELLAVAAVAVVPAALLAIATLASPLGPAGGRAGPVALSAALGCLALALVVSAGVQVLLARRHAPRAPAAPRATVDLALAAALGLALWQVWAAPRGGGTTPGAATLDPVLVVAPAVALGAAGVLVVRALGPAGRVLGRLARRDGAVAALVGWHAARRGTRPAAPLVALVVVAALAVVALSARATVEHATRDRTAAESGGDVAVTRSTLRPPADDGGESVTPVVGLAGSLGEENVQVLAADTAALPAVTHRAGRWALTADDVRGLAGGRGGLPLPPGDTLSLTAAMVTTVALLPGDPGGEADPGGAPAQRAVTAYLAGDDGIQRTLRLPDLPDDGRPHTLTARLPADLAGGARLLGLEVDVPVSTASLLSTTLDVERLVVGDGAGERDAPAVRRTWSARPLGGLAIPDGSPPEAQTGVPGVVVRLTTIPYGGEGTLPVRLLPDPAASPTALPAVLDRGLAARIGVGPGDLVDADVAGETLKLRVVRTVDGLPGGRPPGVPDDGLVAAGPAPGVLVDLAALGEAGRQLGRRALPDPVDWWLGTPRPRGTADAVGEALPDAGVSVRADLVERRLADPFNEGLRRILLLAALAALAVALGALLLGGAVTTAGRRTELVVLRALGMASGQVRRLLVVERVLVGGAALAAGLALGVAVTPVVVPALTGVPVAGGAGVRVAWLPVAGVAVVLAAVVAGGAVAAGRRAARLRPATVLREDAG